MSSGLISSCGYSIASSFGACCPSTLLWVNVFSSPCRDPVERGPNCTRSATTSVRYCLPFSGLSHVRVWMRPSINAELPFFRYCAEVSAWRPKTTTLWNSVDSCFVPSALEKTRFVASPNEHTLPPDGSERSSGSRVRLPKRNTLLMYIDV